MSVPVAALADVFGLPRLWVGAIAAVVGLMFWIVGLVALNYLFERYVRDDDGSPGESGDRP